MRYRSEAHRVYAPVSVRDYPAEYFSGADTSIFFNDKHIDEITALEYQLIEKCVPIYGYASYTPDRIIHGSRLVTGKFATNMRSGDYMHELLYKQIVDDISVGNLTLPVSDVLHPVPQPDPVAQPDEFAQWVLQQKASFWDSVQQTVAAGQTPDLAAVPYFVNNGFTLMIVFGDVDTNDISRNAGRIRTIDNVHIWSTGTRIDLDPQNIIEVWNFVAADLNSDNRSVV